MMRSVGGALFIVGAIIMAYNLFKTAKLGVLEANEKAEAVNALKVNAEKPKNEYWHKIIERKPVRMLVLSLIVILIGGMVEIIPTFLVSSNIPTISNIEPYSPLELEGRDIYIREGCSNCHSQMVRPLRFETARYGEYSKGGEFIYDHPFLWGSKRTGPDLHREGVGNKQYRPDSWHYLHMMDPTSISPGSIMPAYGWLSEDNLNRKYTMAKISAMRSLGVPYPDNLTEQSVNDSMDVQARNISVNILNDITGNNYTDEDIQDLMNKEIIALIAYLQRLGSDIHKPATTQE